MRTISPKLVALALLGLFAPGRCLALWSIDDVTPERAKALGIVIQSKPAGPKVVRIELEFPIDGKLKDFNRVDLRYGTGNESALTVPLKEDRSRPDHVVVSFSADRTELDQINLWIMVPGSLGGIAHNVRVKDFIGAEASP